MHLKSPIYGNDVHSLQQIDYQDSHDTQALFISIKKLKFF